jgi:hypothetical protein
MAMVKPDHDEERIVIASPSGEAIQSTGLPRRRRPKDGS